MDIPRSDQNQSKPHQDEPKPFDGSEDRIPKRDMPLNDGDEAVEEENVG